MNSSEQAKADRKNANKSKYAHCKKGEMNIKRIFFHPKIIFVFISSTVFKTMASVHKYSIFH